jgi:hypothetical protein
MPITVSVDQPNNLTTFIVRNEISSDDVLTALKSIYEKRDLNPTKYFLWNYREGTPDPTIRNEDLEKIVSYSSAHAFKREGGKTAIVARADFEFDVSKKFELFTQLKGLSITVEVFRSLGEAMIWLNERV